MPPTVDSFSRYNLRNANDIRMVEARTNLYYQSFLPSVVRDWNSLDDEDRTSASVSSFKNRLNRNRMIIPRYYYVGDRKLQVLHTRLRTKCSSLNYDLFLKNTVYVTAVALKVHNIIFSIVHFILIYVVTWSTIYLKYALFHSIL